MPDNKKETKKVEEVKKVVTQTEPPKEEEKHAGGRPPIWTSPQILQKLIENYFTSEKLPTLSGLAYSLDISRSTLYNYAEKDEFLDTIKKARARIEMIYEGMMIHGGANVTGVIFALKNMGWADKTDIDHTSKGEKINVAVISYEDAIKPKEENE